jgi:hypothetical protein
VPNPTLEETHVTATLPTVDLPDYNGETVHRTAVKFTGVGTGFTGLDVQPVVMELDEEAYFVVRVTAAESASHYHDKDGHLVRMQRLRAEDMAPVDKDTAQRALQEYAQRIEAHKAEMDNQLLLDMEADATAREAADGGV